MIKFYGYKNCDTCRKAEKYLKSKEKEYKFVDITENPPSGKLLKQAASDKGDFKKLFNTSGVLYREMKIKDKLPSMSEKDALTLLAKHGKLIKRPMVFEESKSTVGFRPDEFAKVWK